MCQILLLTFKESDEMFFLGVVDGLSSKTNMFQSPFLRSCGGLKIANLTKFG